MQPADRRADNNIMEMEDKVNLQNKNAIKGGGANSVLREGPYVRLINNLVIYHCKAFKACLLCCISMDTHTSFSSNIEQLKGKEQRVSINIKSYIKRMFDSAS